MIILIFENKFDPTNKIYYFMQYQQHPHNFNPIQPPQARQTDRS